MLGYLSFVFCTPIHNFSMTICNVRASQQHTYANAGERLGLIEKQLCQCAFVSFSDVSAASRLPGMVAVRSLPADTLLLREAPKLFAKLE